MRWHCLQHVPFERSGLLKNWVADRGHTLAVTNLWEGGPLPAPDDYDGLFILGGPMNVYEESLYPWLGSEKLFIADAVADGKPILGICLGAQLLAVVLGGAVTKSRDKEIGWFPVELTAEGRVSELFHDFVSPLTVFHWHGDRFLIPAGATHIATSAACTEQAFVYDDRVVGLQFHLETDAHSVAALVAHCGDELVEGPYIQDAAAIRSSTKWFPSAHEHLFKLLDRLSQ